MTRKLFVFSQLNLQEILTLLIFTFFRISHQRKIFVLSSIDTVRIVPIFCKKKQHLMYSKPLKKSHFALIMNRYVSVPLLFFLIEKKKFLSMFLKGKLKVWYRFQINELLFWRDNIKYPQKRYYSIPASIFLNVIRRFCGQLFKRSEFKTSAARFDRQETN